MARGPVGLIAETPHLDWLLLTKRPQNIEKMLPVMDSAKPGYRPWAQPWPWPNVWLGTTAESQIEFDRRWPILAKIPAAVRFISYEPALSMLDLRGRLSCGGCPGCNSLDCGNHGLHWLICGGESGGHARDMPAQWPRHIKEQCEAAGIAFFMKQMARKQPIPPDLLVRQFPVLT